MKKLIIILILTIIFSLKVYSQNDSSNKLSDSMDLKQHSIYFEALGNILYFYSFNYEITLIKIKNSNETPYLFSIRNGIGIGFMVDGGSVTTINWQYGLNKRLELGIGIVYTFGNIKDSWKTTYLEGTKSNFLFTFTCGYRYVPLNEKWLFRAGFTPVISLEGIFQPGLGISYGWTF